MFSSGNEQHVLEPPKGIDFYSSEEIAARRSERRCINYLGHLLLAL